MLIETWVREDAIFQYPDQAIVAMQRQVNPGTETEVIEVAHQNEDKDHHGTFVEVHDEMEWKD